jgi:hypothetical protein
MGGNLMAIYDVAIVRREVTLERYYITVEADSEEHAMARVHGAYLGDGEPLTDNEDASMTYSKCLGCDESEVVEVLWAKEMEEI